MVGPVMRGRYTAVATQGIARWEIVADASHLAEPAVDHVEAAAVPDASDPDLMRLTRFARQEDERIRGMLTALWTTRPRVVTAELFR